MPRTVGLVLGAGGVVGGAYHAGTLAALHDVTGWDPRRADLVVGTSAGALSGATLRAGLSAADLYARACGRPLSLEGRALLTRLRGDRPGGVPERPRVRLSRPAAPQLLAALFPPWTARPGAALAGMLPQGSVPTAVIGDGVRDLYGDEPWPRDPLWICALRLRDGARVVFGRDALAVPDVGTAVEASAAIPGYFRPVRLGADTYVDGGAHSPTNADLLRGLGLDLAVVVSTMSASWSALRPSPFVGSRVIASWALEREVRAIRASGTPVLVIQPTAADLRVMGYDAMDASRQRDVAAQARDSAEQRLAHPSATELVELLGTAMARR